MADTQRTLASLQSLLADNSTGAISEQDERDMLVSCYRRGHGSIAVSAGATAQTSVSTTFVKLTAFAVESSGALAVLCTPSHSGDTVTVTEGGVWAVHFSCSFLTSGGLWTFAIFANAADSGFHAVVDTDNLVGDNLHVSIHGLVSISASQVIEVRVKNNTAGEDITVIAAQLMVERVNSGV